MSSFLTQYGIRIQSPTFETMKWDEFKDLLAGLSPDTPLGRIVQIRNENDKDTLKHFTKDMHKIRNDWKNRKAKTMSREQYNAEMQNLENMIRKMINR